MPAPLLPLKLDAGRMKQFTSSDRIDARVMGGTPGTSRFLRSNASDNYGNWTLVEDIDLKISDVTTNNVSIFKHGFVPKASALSTDYLSGNGDWRSLPASGDASSSASVSVAGEAVVFDGTTGKLIKRAAGSGVAKLTSGVLSAANVVESEITLADNTTNNFNATKHGFVPKAPGGTTAFLREDGIWVTPAGTGDVVGPAVSVANEVALFDGITGKLVKRATGSGVAKLTSGVLSAANVVESEITLADNTTNDASITNHGFLKKLSNVATEFMNGVGNWATPPQGNVVGPASAVANEIVLFDLTTGKLVKRATGSGIVRVSSGVYGMPGNIVESEITLADNTTNNASTSAHGFLKKLTNVANQFMNAQGNWAVPATVLPSGVVQLISVDETPFTASGTNTSAKSYTLATNTYSYIIAECEITYVGTANTICEIAAILKFGASTVQSLDLRSDATGAGDLIKLSGVLKYAGNFAAGGSITIGVTATAGSATYSVRSLRVYGVV